MHSIYEHAPIGVGIVDLSDDKLEMLYANQLFPKMFPDGLPENILQALRDKKEIAALDLPLADKDAWGRLTLAHTKLDNRLAAILWISDISEVKKAAREALNLMEMKSEFLAAMSHEIRTPMQSIYGLLELINDEQINDAVRDMSSNARKSASGLLEILDDILDLAKVEAGKIELDNFETPVRTLAYGVMECLEIKCMSKDIEMLTDIEQDVPFVVMGDPTRLRQIMLNLVSNAIKFTEEGSITLRITTKTKAITPQDDGIALRFEVEDTGIGMPPHVRDKLFQAFTQADNSTTRKYGGTGLGLSISAKLVRLMNGKIGVDSVEGKGSTFWFEIQSRPASEQAAIDLPDLSGLAVLSVEDHPKGAKEIASSLVSMGAKVESVASYQEGLDIIKKRPFDVAVVDQGLPGGLGIDLLKEAARVRPFMGLILYTVRNDIGMQYTAKVIGAKYLSKPASRLGLGDAVKSAARQMIPQNFNGSRRLLIAEDTASVRDILKRQLEKLSIEADFVINGVEALKALESKKYGILFTDLHMPEMDGYQLLSAIRCEEDNNGIDPRKRFPVIALTADVQLAQRRAYLSYGFDECLLKPVSLGQVRQLLVRWGVLREEDIPAAAVITAPSAVPPAALPPAVDRNAMIAQMGAFDESAIEMLKMFVGMTRPSIDKMDAAFAAKNTHALRELAHSLKGGSRSAGCLHLGNLAAEMQENAEKGNPITESHITTIKSEFQRVSDEVNAMHV